ncbi:MAG: hypothetical protein AAB869_00540 [Patescibacteria group bacterium]
MTRYIFPIFILIIAIATYELYIQPLYGEIGRSLAKEVEVRAALVEVDTAQAKLDEITRRYESFPKDANERLSQIIPESVDPIRLLIDTTAFIERNGFSAKSLKVSENTGKIGGATPVAPYQTHVITFTLSASYDTFREFLRELEASLALRDVVDVSFVVVPSSSAGGEASVGERPELLIHDYTVRIVSYSLH